MPRGTETQEPQEGREINQEGQEANQEAERTQEAVEQPQAVVDRERPIEESEKIEREVVEAVEAAEAAADGGRGTEDGSEVSTLPVPIPDQPDRPGDEISATPIPLPGQPDRPADEISATPIPLPGEEIVDPDGEISATPIPLPGEESIDPDGIKSQEVETRIADGEAVENLDETSFKVESPSPEWEEDPPKPPQGTMEDARSESEDGEESTVTDEKVILDTDSFKPVPALSPDAFKIEEGGLETEEGKRTPTQPVIEKELPEGGQMEESLDQREDLQGLMDEDLDSLIPDGGEIVGADGKKATGSKYGDELGNLPGMGSGGKIDGSSEDPSGDQFAGKGMFKPGKGPDGGTVADQIFDEAEVMAMLESNASEKEIAAKEKQLQEKALDEYQLIYTSPKKQKSDSEDPPKPKKGTKKSTPGGEEGGGSSVKRVTQAELDTVIDEVDGSQISTQDPDDQSGEVPDRLTPEGAKKVKDALDQVASTKHKQKKAGSEVITDPDSEDPEVGELGKKLDL